MNYVGIPSPRHKVGFVCETAFSYEKKHEESTKDYPLDWISPEMAVFGNFLKKNGWIFENLENEAQNTKKPCNR